MAAADLAADQSQQSTREWLHDDVADRTRQLLIEQCAEEGSIARGAWHDFEREFGSTTAASFVAVCESCETCVWTDMYAVVEAETIEPAEDYAQ